MSRIVALLSCVVLGIGALAWLGVPPFWSFTQSVRVDDGTYFRLKLDFAYKGEPNTFDVVYSCNIRTTRYKDGSRSVESGTVPAIYGRRMGDGQLVAVRSVDGCRHGTTASGGIPEKVLPLMIVFPNADDPSFGIGYVSDDAYDSPLSDLRFGKAVIEAATRRDYLTFRRRADNDLARPRPGTNSIVDDALRTYEMARSGGLNIAAYCNTVVRVRIPEEARAQVRAAWPADRPEYWNTPIGKGDGVDNSATQIAQQALRRYRALSRSDREDDEPRPYPNMSFRAGEPADYGMPNRFGVTIAGILPRYPAAYYPWEYETRLRKWLIGRMAPPWSFEGNDPNARVVDVRDGSTRGFAYCGTSDLPSTDIVKVNGKPARSGSSPSVLERDRYFYSHGQSVGAISFGGRM